MKPMKPMKPCKAWAVVTPSDHLAYNEHNELHILRRKLENQRMCKYGFRPLRVRILEDAAVERAIAALQKYAANDDDVTAAIRDLGGGKV